MRASRPLFPLFLLVSLVAGMPAPAGAGLERPFIVGGREAQPGAWPWQVNLQQGGQPSCGGSLIAESWVLTAAHCFFEGEDGQPKMRVMDSAFSVVLGDHDTSVAEPSDQSLQAAQVLIHEGYNPDGQTTAENDNDVALVRLASPATLNDRVQLIALVTAAEEPAEGATVTVTGWGATMEGQEGGSTVLKQVDLPFLTTQSCRARDPGITDNMVCAGGTPQGGEDSCQGDSGGPLVVASGGGYKQVGVVSFGEGCARPNTAGVYARVSRYRDWIAGKMGGGSQPSGLQTTSDGQLVLINKPVGAEQWAITVHGDGSVTGNVFRTDGGDPTFLDCMRLGDDGNPDPAQQMIRFSCGVSNRCTTAQCPGASDWMTLAGEVTLPGSFLLPRATGGAAGFSEGDGGQEASDEDRVEEEWDDEDDLGLALGGAAPASGLQTTADGRLTLINKPVGSEQWAITVSPDGRVTGNVFFTDGRDPTFLDCMRLGDDGNPDPAMVMIRYSCAVSAKCGSAQCPGASDWMMLPNEVPLPGSFLLPRVGG